jgi:hypothetical protein
MYTLLPPRKERMNVTTSNNRERKHGEERKGSSVTDELERRRG